MVRWTYQPEDLERLKKEFGSEDSLIAFAENKRYTRYQLMKIYALILDKRELKVIQLTLNLEKKKIDTVPLAGLETFKVSGRGTKTLKIKSPETKYCFLIRPLTKKVRPYQEKFNQQLEQMALNYN